MVAKDPHPDKTAAEITEEVQWTLKEIREAYREILRAYDELFPLHPEPRRRSASGRGTSGIDPEDDSFHD